MSHFNDNFRLRPILLFWIFWFAISGCRDDNYFDKYARPDWLAGKVYTQVKAQPELSVFAECIELTGYDTIINKSGSYTVFGPNNEAFQAWLIKNNYSSIKDVPLSLLQDLVSYHLIQNAWSKVQLRTVDVYGWIDTLDESNNKARGFKRETYLKNENRFYPVINENKGYRIVDLAESQFQRKVITDSRKYAPLFYNEYFNIYELNSDDYKFYFDRPFTGGDDIFYVNAKIISDEIKAENGFIYIVDQVVEPLQSAYQILEDSKDDNDYSEFLNLLNYFPLFNYNEQKTKQQPGAELGLEVDSLFDLRYPELAFSITSEKTQAPLGSFGLPGNVSIRYHHGMMAPTNQAFDQLINDFIKVPGGWGSLERSPLNIKRIIANTHLSINPGYPSDFERGFYNGENDAVHINTEDVVQKEYGSNCTFIGLSKAIVPKAFSSVTGPVYLQPGYSTTMYAIEGSGLLPALKRENKNYMFFVESDFSLQDDSSLVYNPIKKDFTLFLIQPVGVIKYQLNKNDLRTLLLNHVAVDRPKGLARKEFIPNLAGNFIIFNNVTGEVSGTSNTTIGYQGNVVTQDFPRLISQGAENGETYEIKNWFNFKSNTLYSEIQTSYPAFYALMKRAGLVLEREYKFSFISDNEFYTVFIPSDAALSAANVNSLSNEDLKKLILLHFIQGNMIFTDGNKNPGYYETNLTAGSSSSFNSGYVKIYLETGIDKITIKAKDGSAFTEINESESANKLTGITVTSVTLQVFPNISNNAVIHKIDRVLSVNELDTN